LLLQDYEFMRAGEELVKFSRIIFNFPCVGLLDEQQQQVAQEEEAKKLERRLQKAGKGRKSKGDEKQSSYSKAQELEKGRAEAAARRALAEKKLAADSRLLSEFLMSAKDHLEDERSQIHISLRRVTVETVGTRGIEKLSHKAGMTCVESSDFHPGYFAGYVPQQTHPKGKGLQPLTPAMFFSFRLRAEGEEGSASSSSNPASEDDEATGPRVHGEEEEEAEGARGVYSESEEEDGRGVYSDAESDEEGGGVEGEGEERGASVGSGGGGGVREGAQKRKATHEPEVHAGKKKRKKSKKVRE
jgi:hypothetical protein